MINSIAVTQTRSSPAGNGAKALVSSSDAFQPLGVSLDKEARSLVLLLAQQQLGILANKDVRALSDEDLDDAKFLSNLIRELSEEEAYEAAYEFIDERMKSFEEYLRESAEDRQIVQAVQTGGGSVLGDYEEFFVAEDPDGNRYIIEKQLLSEYPFS